MLYGGHTLSQGDAVFGHTSFNPAFVNPGYAGSDTSNYFNVIALNKMQMTGFEKYPTTTALNVNGPLNIGGTSGGLNVTFINDQAGFISAPSFALGYAYKMDFYGGSLGLGLSAGVFFSTLEAGSWNLPDNNDDPAIPTAKSSKQSFDLALGAYYHNNKWYAGLSVTHLIPPVLFDEDVKIVMPRNYYFMAGYEFRLDNPDFTVRPSILTLTDLKSFVQSINALMFYRNKYWIGLDYRIKSSIGIIAGLNLTPELRLGYSYGYNTSLLSKFSGGNHEVMITYRFSVMLRKEKLKYKSVRYL
ncbi:MAG: PorP/SprF family type IX secretion system membrane protein [Prevotellaceae bacterium]|nr:PorP/SprF family type IX secretion system membrane protein [Prevotellaceae bacterium]